MWGKRETLTAKDNDFAPLPLEGADERSEAGLASPNVGVSLHAACIVIGIFAPSLLYPLLQTRPYHFLFKGRII